MSSYVHNHQKEQYNIASVRNFKLFLRNLEYRTQTVQHLVVNVRLPLDLVCDVNWNRGVTIEDRVRMLFVTVLI